MYEMTRHLKFRYISILESVEDLQESKYNEILNVSSFHLYFVTFSYIKA